MPAMPARPAANRDKVRGSGTSVPGGSTPIEAARSYKVAGWASVNEQTGAPVWEVLAKHLRAGKTSPQRGSDVTLKGVEDNPGIAG